MNSRPDVRATGRIVEEGRDSRVREARIGLGEGQPERSAEDHRVAQRLQSGFAAVGERSDGRTAPLLIGRVGHRPSRSLVCVAARDTGPRQQSGHHQSEHHPSSRHARTTVTSGTGSCKDWKSAHLRTVRRTRCRAGPTPPTPHRVHRADEVAEVEALGEVVAFLLASQPSKMS
jgi:hypothetical protein